MPIEGLSRFHCTAAPWHHKQDDKHCCAKNDGHKAAKQNKQRRILFDPVNCDLTKWCVLRRESEI